MVEEEIPKDLLWDLTNRGQAHLFQGWDELSSIQKGSLVNQIRNIDFDLIASIWNSRNKPARAMASVELLAPDFFDPQLDPDQAATCHQLGSSALSQGKVACVLVAGGQGTRFGATIPKGCMAVGPLSGKSLFQIHAERIQALARRFGATVPLLVMTSPANHDATLAFFTEHRNFGLITDQVHFFCQGTMPAMDLETGKILLEAPGRIFASPDGHGGCLAALAEKGWLKWMAEKEIEQVFYFQVDNPLVKIADPLFLGHHLHSRADVSSRFVTKERAAEKVGVFAQTKPLTNEARCILVEYSDLTGEQTEARAPNEELLFRCGSPAIHIFSRRFLEEIVPGHARLPYHLAKKKVSFVDETGATVVPVTENAFKFEKFVFDALPLANRWTLVRSLREEEFAPLKNAVGSDSPDTVRAGIIARNRAWLSKAFGAAGAEISMIDEWIIEISPLLALDAADLAEQLSYADFVASLSQAKDGSLHLKAASE